MQRFLKSLNLNSEFLRYVMILLTGTVLAQIINFLMIPIISRIYTPEENAELGIFIRIITFGSAIATAKYELALPILKLDEHSWRLYKFTIRLIIRVTLISALLSVFWWFFQRNLGDLVFYILIPIGIAVLAFINMGTNWAIRTKQFRDISYHRIINSVIGSVAKIGLGLLNTGYIGLIIGTVVGLFTSAIFFIKSFLSSNKTFKISKYSNRNFALARQNSIYPTISLPHTLMDLGRDLLVGVLIWELFGQKEFGLYSQTYLLLRLPITVIGVSLSQVFFQRTSELMNQGKSTLPVFRKSIILLGLAAVIPFFVLFFFGEEIFSWFLGSMWSESGIYAEIMASWLVLMLIVSPISALPLVLGKQKSFLITATIGSLIMVLTLVIPPLWFDADIYSTLWILALSQSIYLLCVIYIIYLFIQKTPIRSKVD